MIILSSNYFGFPSLCFLEYALNTVLEAIDSRMKNKGLEQGGDTLLEMARQCIHYSSTDGRGPPDFSGNEPKIHPGHHWQEAYHRRSWYSRRKSIQFSHSSGEADDKHEWTMPIEEKVTIVESHRTVSDEEALLFACMPPANVLGLKWSVSKSNRTGTWDR